jgi:small basic protein
MAPHDLAYPATYDNIISAQELVKNYGSVYKTTGGGLDSEKAYKFVHKFIDNRILNIYLTYLGITTLTPTTLVPIALIYGQHAFKKALKYIKNKEQSGGSIPVLDNNLVGTYLKIAGLSKLSLSPQTLVPLGLAMAIYKAFSKKKT